MDFFIVEVQTLELTINKEHCVKSVQLRSFWENTDQKKLRI